MWMAAHGIWQPAKCSSNNISCQLFDLLCIRNVTYPSLLQLKSLGSITMASAAPSDDLGMHTFIKVGRYNGQIVAIKPVTCKDIIPTREDHLELKLVYIYVLIPYWIMCPISVVQSWVALAHLPYLPLCQCVTTNVMAMVSNYIYWITLISNFHKGITDTFVNIYALIYMRLKFFFIIGIW